MKRFVCMLTVVAVLLVFSSVSFAGLNNFAGTWKNVNTRTRGITKLVISVKGRTATVHAWGKCRPRDCNWGTVSARYYKNNSLRATYRTKIATRSLVLTFKGKSRLKASVKTHYTDKSGRKDRRNTYTFKRAATTGKIQRSKIKPVRSAAATRVRSQGTASTSKRVATTGKIQRSKLRPVRTAAATGVRSQGTASTSKPAGKGKITVLYPRRGAKLVAGKQYTIRWKSTGNVGKVNVTLWMENIAMKAAGRSKGPFPVYSIARQVRNTGSCRFKVPYRFNSHFGNRYYVNVSDGGVQGMSNISIYPLIDVAPTNIKVYSYEKKKKHAWILRTVNAVASGGVTEAARQVADNRQVAAVVSGGATEAARRVAGKRQVNAVASGGTTEAIRWVASKGKITKKTRIKIKFDLTNYGTKILRRKFMTKVSVRVRPGNDELNSAGFSHDKIIPILPGKLYHYETDIKPSDWNILPGRYSLELYTDPGHMLAEPAELRKNNKKTVDFEVGRRK